MLARRVRLATVAVAPALAALAALTAAPAALAGTPAATSDLSVSVETTSTSLGLGDRVEFAVTVQNQGPDAGGGDLRMRWSSGLSYVSEQRSGIGVCVQGSPPARLASCSLDALDPAATATMTLVMNGNEVGRQTLDLVVHGTNQDPNLADNRDSVTIEVLGPLAGPTASPPVVRPGLTPTPTPSPSPSPTPSPIPSGGIQTGAGGTAGRSTPAVLILELAFLAAVGVGLRRWYARRRKAAP